MTVPPRRPATFRLDEVDLSPGEADFDPRSEEGAVLPDPAEPDQAAPLAPPPRRGARWGRLLLAGLGGLASIGLGLAIDGLIREAFSRAEWLGWTAALLAVLAALALIAFGIREMGALLRLRRMATIQADAAAALATDDRSAAIAVGRQLIALYDNRPETARGRAALKGHLAEIIDGSDLIRLAEHELLRDLDRAAQRTILAAAQRVSLVTAISPRALIDIVYVAVENVRLMRRIAQLYGGRPGTLGFFRLARSVVTHLALTGGMAAGESVVQQLVGQGLAARLSARLGEGIVNGMLTARVGLAAMGVCRPLPFVAERPPRLADMLTELARSVGGKADQRRQ